MRYKKFVHTLNERIGFGFIKRLLFISEIKKRCSYPRKLTNYEIKMIYENFDNDYYLKNNPDVAISGMDPFKHYMTYGWKEKRNPSPFFDTEFYLFENRDILEAGINPFVHYILYGKKEGRKPLPPQKIYKSTDEYMIKEMGLTEKQANSIKENFDDNFYCERYMDIHHKEIDPLLHFLYWGWKEHRDPSPKFSTSYYLESNPDIAQSGQNPFVHWVLHGRAEGRPGCPENQALDETPACNVVPNTADVDWQSCPKEDIEAISEFFDESYYIKKYPEVYKMGVDPKVHYLLIGWKQGYDPTPDFSTKYYLSRYPDVRKSGMNPFLHYCKFGKNEKREAISYIQKKSRNFRPLVSVIVPNYNHEKYIKKRILSIANQSYDNIELIILDDNSSDNSRDVIKKVVSELDIDARLEFNNINSGNVFRQWRKGIEIAQGDLIWICESDDFCEPDFLEKIIKHFIDQSVNIVFGRILFADEDDNFIDGLDEYREYAEPGIWNDTIIRPASEWFHGALGVFNVISNVGGAVFRRMQLKDEIWNEAETFRICGDWFLYLHFAGAGQIVYEPRAVSYFRQHQKNTSSSNFDKMYYFEENKRIIKSIIKKWGVDDKVRRRFIEKLEYDWCHVGMDEKHGAFKKVFDIDDIFNNKKTEYHIQIYFLGFHTGGGELFPINLANAFVEQGLMVSMVAMDLENINPDMRTRLDNRVPVYHAIHLIEKGRGNFLRSAGVDIINSHVVNADAFLGTLGEDDIECPYVVTLHGSYVSFANAPQNLINWVLKNVHKWIYTAEKNLDFFKGRDVDFNDFIKLPNALPRDMRDAKFTRKDLGIKNDDVVFSFVARGIKSKGWCVAVEAFRLLREHYGCLNTHLLMVGEGERTNEARERASNLDGIHFLGYQSEINGIFRLSDVFILPSRFEGESYPLCLIQAIQEGLPVIATDIGEVRSMMSVGEEVAGFLLEYNEDDRSFAEQLCECMNLMCNRKVREFYSNVSKMKRKDYDMNSLVKKYQEVFDMAIKKSNVNN